MSEEERAKFEARAEELSIVEVVSCYTAWCQPYLDVCWKDAKGEYEWTYLTELQTQWLRDYIQKKKEREISDAIEQMKIAPQTSETNKKPQ